MEIQHALGSDIMMAFDECAPWPAERRYVEESLELTTRWLARCKKAHDDYAASLGGESQVLGEGCNQSLFGIMQGGVYKDLRRESAERIAEMDLPGYSIGGLSVGETPKEMYDCIEAVAPYMPADKPRYLMGVGRPEDLLEGIKRGVDMFDCVMPSRNGRNAMAFTDHGPMRLRNARYERDPRPLEEKCPCPACRRSRAYLRHLFVTGEMLGPILLTIHNVTYYQRLVAGARKAIEEDRYQEYYDERFAGWRDGVPD